MPFYFTSEFCSYLNQSVCLKTCPWCKGRECVLPVQNWDRETKKYLESFTSSKRRLVVKFSLLMYKGWLRIAQFCIMHESIPCFAHYRGKLFFTTVDVMFCARPQLVWEIARPRVQFVINRYEWFWKFSKLRVQFENFQNHEYLLFTNCTRRSCDFFYL